MRPKQPVLRFLYYWIPPFLWMAFIFFLSSRHSVSVTHTFVFDFIIFKTLHVIEYATLYFLLYRALHSTKLSFSSQYWGAAVIAALYAMSDEFHQSFTPSRTPTVRDVLIDIGGIMITYALIRRFPKLFKKIL